MNARLLTVNAFAQRLHEDVGRAIDESLKGRERLQAALHAGRGGAAGVARACGSRAAADAYCAAKH